MQGQQRKNIKQYLLGESIDEKDRQDIELRFLTDDEFAEELAICEDELIEAYLDNQLNAQERLRFEQHFLALPESQEKFKFAQTFRARLAKEKPRAIMQEAHVQSIKPKRPFFRWFQGFAPVPTLAALGLVLFGGIGLWYIFSRQSDLDKGLVALNKVYADKRVFQSRIVDFNYAPLNDTRGENNKDSVDKTARNRAERLLLDAVTENKNVSSLYALGKFYLAEKNLDEAINYLEQAAQLKPNNAKLYSDLGAAYLEAGKKAALSKDGARNLELLDKSLKNLHQAIQLDAKLLEPRFNRALCLEAAVLPEQAKQAWREYLQLDSSSKWADEARQHLQALEAQKRQNVTAAELEKAFLIAFQNKDQIAAAQLINQNKEIITEKYLPQKLAFSFVESEPSDKNQYLQALIYAGEIEKKNIGDLFASDLAKFYTNISAINLESLKQAQDSMRSGYKSCLAGEFSRALKEFNLARELFLKTNNVWEARLSEFLIVYCFNNTDKIKESIFLAEEIKDFCRQRNYKWLLANVLYWLAGDQRALGQRAASKINGKDCLLLAEQINDNQIYQKILLDLAKESNFLNQEKITLNYLQKILESTGDPKTISRQKWRNYSDAVERLANVKFASLAKVVSLENIQLAEELKDSLFVVYSQIDAGVAHSRTGEFETARNWFEEARRSAESIEEEAERKSLLAKCSLELGHIERKFNNNEQATQFYDQALHFVKDAETPYYFYEIQKSRLLAYLALNRGVEIESQISETIKLAEKYREQIAEEQERNSFFDNEQDIYDVAIANQFQNARYEQAYNYLENSNSRSLLNWLQNGAKVNGDNREIKVTFDDNTTPLKLDEIRPQILDQVQLLQYAVLENKVLIWLIAKDKFAVVSTEIDSQNLAEKVEEYIRLVSVNDDAKQAASETLSRELYNLLISPISDQFDSKRDICIIPHKFLFKLPFAALIGSRGKPFVFDFNLFYAPSANVFLLCTKNAQQKSNISDESLLSVGDPHFDRVDFENLQYLPAAAEEAREVAKIYPNSQVLLEEKATKTAFQNAIQNVSVVNFAGHYIVRRGDSLSSGLLLAETQSENSVLTNAEIVQQKLPRVKLAVLSACETGVEHYYNGEGPIGLSRSFLIAGAPLVVASHWPVDSAASAELIKRFHSHRRNTKLSTASALRRAQLELQISPNSPFNKPYFWAAFAVFGGYTTF